jgi:hypothetical protein
VRTLWWIRFWLVIVMVGLVVSGSDRFPLEAELRLGSNLLHADWSPASA